MNARRIVLTLLTLAVAGCSGPKLAYDPAPAPGWIREVPAGIDTRALTAVGAAPATTDPKRDLDLATRHAKSQVAQMFESQVVSRVSDWSLVMTGGKAEAEMGGVQQSIEVRSSVAVEDVRVEASYRDEETRTQYVRITVDRAAWVQRLRGRLADGLRRIENKLAAAREALEARRPLGALQTLLEGSRRGRSIEPDVVVIDLLDRGLAVRDRLRTLKEQMDALGRRLRADHALVINVRSTDPKAASMVRGNLEQFLGRRGFTVASGADASRGIRIDISLAHRRVATEEVAGRREHVVAGTGVLRVRDADGSDVSGLTVRFESDRYQERDTDEEKARQKALALAADTVCSKFRSAFRKVYESAE